jgi:hypothetical protein
MNINPYQWISTGETRWYLCSHVCCFINHSRQFNISTINSLIIIPYHIHINYMVPVINSIYISINPYNSLLSTGVMINLRCFSMSTRLVPGGLLWAPLESHFLRAQDAVGLARQGAGDSHDQRNRVTSQGSWHDPTLDMGYVIGNIIYIWLVVWTMSFIFPNSWDDDPIWLIFFEGVETTK